MAVDPPRMQSPSVPSPLNRSLLIGFKNRLANHVDADDSEQSHDDPVINRCYIIFKQGGGEVADEGEQGLEPSKPEPDQPVMTYFKLADGESLAYGHGKGICRHA